MRNYTIKACDTCIRLHRRRHPELQLTLAMHSVHRLLLHQICLGTVTASHGYERCDHAVASGAEMVLKSLLSIYRDFSAYPAIA
jgi:hypothetical protein